MVLEKDKAEYESQKEEKELRQQLDRERTMHKATKEEKQLLKDV